MQYDFADASQHPDTAAAMELRPEVCTDTNGYTHPDTSVILVAQIVVSGTVLIAAFVFFVLQAQPSPIIKGLLAFFLLDCLLMLFGYYYLNAIVIFTAVISAGICFSVKSDAAAAVGFGIVLAALYWVTFESGLGFIQHHSRFTAGDATTDAYERMCNNYYRGYFFFPVEAHKDNENIANTARGLCDRSWLGAQLFFTDLRASAVGGVHRGGGLGAVRGPARGRDGVRPNRRDCQAAAIKKANKTPFFLNFFPFSFFFFLSFLLLFFRSKIYHPPLKSKKKRFLILFLDGSYLLY